MPTETVTITEIEAAINAWSQRRPASGDGSYRICPQVRVLADVYGVMIYDRRETVARASLTPAQLEALDKAGAQ